MIIVVDYGMGNLRSIEYKLQKEGVAAAVSSDPAQIRRADKLILPGVGYFSKGMQNLSERGLTEALTEAVMEEGKPVMGICLGMQLFTRWSEEGDAPGLGWIEADTRRFDFSAQAGGLTVPHVGWETLTAKKKHRLLDGVETGQRFYFTHSYHVVCERAEDVLTSSRYGYEFVSSVQHGNICGTQFHPEKSHRRGFQMILNFAGSPH